MARTLVPTDIIPPNGSYVAGTGVVNDPTNGHEADNSGTTIFTHTNTAGSTKTVTYASVADAYGRVGDLAVVVPAASGSFNGVATAGPFNPTNWNLARGTRITFSSTALATEVKHFASRYQA